MTNALTQCIWTGKFWYVCSFSMFVSVIVCFTFLFFHFFRGLLKAVPDGHISPSFAWNLKRWKYWSAWILNRVLTKYSSLFELSTYSYTNATVLNPCHAQYIKMLLPRLTVSQSDYLIQTDTNKHTVWQTVQIKISRPDRSRSYLFAKAGRIWVQQDQS